MSSNWAVMITGHPTEELAKAMAADIRESLLMHGLIDESLQTVGLPPLEVVVVEHFGKMEVDGVVLDVTDDGGQDDGGLVN